MPRSAPRPTPAGAKPSLGAVPDGGDGYQDSLTARFAEILDATGPGKRPVQSVEVKVDYKYRAPHEMYGTKGFSQVSNDFVADVLAVLIAQHGMSPIQSAVLLHCIGKQKEGWLRTTHTKIADALGVERANVTRAIGTLEQWHMIKRVSKGLLFVNPLIAFQGNGDRQQDILADLRRGMPHDAFPTLNAPPAPRSVQLELGQDDDREEQAC